MDDLISRQDVIKAVLGSNFSACTVYGRSEEGMATAKELIQAIKNLPSAQPEWWIPCSRRMPKDYENVLVYFEYYRYGDYNCMFSTYGIGDYSSEYDSWLVNGETGWQKLHVFAWMPLPEPYEEEK